MFRIHRRGRPPHPGMFTPAEQRILPYLAAGLTNAEIAIQTGVSVNTVRTHVANMLAKSGVPDRRELARIQTGGGRAARLGGLALALIGGGGVVAVAAVAMALVFVVGRGSGSPESGLAAEVDAPGPFPAAYTVRTITRSTPAGDERAIKVEIWYPAKPGPAGVALRNDVRAYPDAPRSGGPFPLLVFQGNVSGDAAIPHNLAFLFSHLASHGFVVAGLIEPCPDSPCPFAVEDASTTWPADIESVLGGLLALNAGADPSKYGLSVSTLGTQDPVLRGLMDPNRIAMSGVLTGAAASLNVMGADPRFTTGLLLGYVELPHPDAAKVSQPIMFIQGEQYKYGSIVPSAALYAAIPPTAGDHWFIDIHRFNNIFPDVECPQSVTTTPCSQLLPKPLVNTIVKRWATAFLLVNLAGQARYASLLEPPFVPDKETFVSLTRMGATPAVLPTLSPAHAFTLLNILGQPPPPPQVAQKQGTVLLSDTLTDFGGRLPAKSRDPAKYSAGYSAGQYVISEAAGAFRSDTPGEQAEVLVPGGYADASLAVDIALVDPGEDQYVNLGCRSQSDISQYRLSVVPSSGRFALNRWIEGTSAVLTPLQASPAIHRGSATNRLELSCHGTIIEAFINGTRVASVSDGAFGDGQFWIGMGQAIGATGSATPEGANIEAQFSNLVVTQR